jgi:FkbM family methyltransferase
MKIQKTHSQHGEDIAIQELLHGKPKSFIIDVGANDGFSWSNSLSFIELGYPAVLIEPMPLYAQKCRHLHHGNSMVFVEEVAILEEMRTVEFYINNDPERDLLSMASSVRREIIQGDSVVKTTVLACPLRYILGRYNVPPVYSLLNVDAEGVDLDVLKSANLEVYRPQAICVEFGCNEENISAYLRSKSYAHVTTLGPNGIFIPA